MIWVNQVAEVIFLSLIESGGLQDCSLSSIQSRADVMTWDADPTEALMRVD